MQGVEFKTSTSAGDAVGIEWGAPNGRPVLVIHGWLDHADSFKNLAQLLEPSLYLKAMDLSGHGKARHAPKGYRYHLMDWVCEVDQLVNVLGWKEFDMIGHSLGGAIALIYSAVRPGRVKRLVLLDSVGPLNVEPDETASKARSHLEQWDERLPSNRALSLEALIEIRKKSTFTITGSRLSNANAEILVRRAYSQTPQGLVPAFDPRLKLPSIQSMALGQILAFLKAVDASVLLFKAEGGIFREHYGWNERVSALRSVKSLIVPGDHYVHLSNAPSISQEINRFLIV